MSNIQLLLDESANMLPGVERDQIYIMIKLQRGNQPRVCWGEDDCSTQTLSTCPWRIDCDSHAASTWQDTTHYSFKNTLKA